MLCLKPFVNQWLKWQKNLSGFQIQKITLGKIWLINESCTEAEVKKHFKLGHFQSKILQLQMAANY